MSVEGTPEKTPSRFEKALEQAVEEAAAAVSIPEKFNASPRHAELYREEAQKLARSYFEEWMRLLAANLEEHSKLQQNFERGMRDVSSSLPQEEIDSHLRKYSQQTAAKQHILRNQLKLACIQKGVSEHTAETLAEEFMRQQIRAV